MNYYNDNDPKACAWLRELIRAGEIPDGIVDDRDISVIQSSDLAGFVQCHFFAGIGGWPFALKLAGWPEDKEVWTGSCPCPPFSAAGKKFKCPRGCAERNLVPHPLRTGFFVCAECGHEWFADGRHLWPEFYRLIAQRRPAIVFGEQVASADGRIWLDGIRATLEILDYGFGAADLCAAGLGAPHIRQRLFWVAVAEHSQRRAELQPAQSPEDGRPGLGGSGGVGNAVRAGERGGNECGFGEGREQMAQQKDGPDSSDESGNGRQIVGGMEHANGSGRGEQGGAKPVPAQQSPAECPGNIGGVGLSEGVRSENGAQLHGANNREISCDGCNPSGMGNAARDYERRERQSRSGGGRDGTIGGSGAWSDFDLVPCRDGKWRRVESGTFPLAHGVSGRVGLLRGYGNAIVPQVAAEFIKSTIN